MKNRRLSVGLMLAMCSALVVQTSAGNVNAFEVDNAIGDVDAGSEIVSYGMVPEEDNAIERDNMNVAKDVNIQIVSGEEDCGSVIEFVASKAQDGKAIDYDVLIENQRSTSAPKAYWNIAKDGIYNGKFSGVAATIYTNYYFDFVKDNTAEDRYSYWTRVDVSTHLYQGQKTFEVRNYCTKCGLVSSTGEYTTPEAGESTGYIYIKHYFTSKHEGHFMYPAVVCTSSSGKISGTIDVNYYNKWS